MRWLRFVGAIAFAIVAFPVAIIAGLSLKSRNCTPQELAADLQKFSDGTESEMDWDRLESGGRIKDARLEAIRQEALRINPPLQAVDRAKLGELAARTRALFP